ncbi:MAG: 2-(1,2-epoxy-1,2-dihydrophenyl)acetyl-CoA isomerase [Alicyclobacillus sp. RIFOXYA1_FULL_53_8]|nr:MAG: 2-(1,2-epoxy-1,2-dihydrophenyl)acetyl-CoA isomerase [Alicyclobacillus sp. RIFOXYA1_FULL_53_8]
MTERFEFETIEYVVERNVARITLNRPQVMNAINNQLSAELYSAFKAVEQDKSVRAVVLTGNGRAFCSGQDLGDRMALEGPVRLSDSVRERYNLLVAKMQSLSVPVIAAVNGAAAGAGFGLALACDLRFAADTAKFTMAFSKIGLAPDSGTSYFLSRLVGLGKALEWSWTAEVISAPDALQYGAVNRLFAPDDLLKQTLAFAEKLAMGPTLAYGLTKRALYTNFSATLPEALELEAQLQDIAGQSEDFREGVQAFLEKRRPEYRGK